MQPLLPVPGGKVPWDFSEEHRGSLIVLEPLVRPDVELGWFFLKRMKDAFAQERKACPTIALSFDQFQLRHVPSTIPLLIHQVRPALTASWSFFTPAAKDWSSGNSLRST